MATRKKTVFSVSETELNEKPVNLSMESGGNRLNVGDIVLHTRSSAEDKAAMKTFLMKHPKSALVDMFLNLILHAHGR